MAVHKGSRKEGDALAEICRCIIEAGINNSTADRVTFARIIAKHLTISTGGVKNLLQRGRDLGYWTIPDARLRTKWLDEGPLTILLHVPDHFEVRNESGMVDAR